MEQTTGWMLGGLVVLVLLLGGVVVLSVRLHRAHQDRAHQDRAHQDQEQPRQAAFEPPMQPVPEHHGEPEPPLPARQDEDYRREVVQGAQEAVGGTMRRILALTNNAAERLHQMERAHGPDVLEDLLPIDHLLAQAQRRAQLVTVLCGSPPGQQRSPQLLARLVGAAQSRIHDYDRVRLSTRDITTAVLGRVVEPISAALAELLDNATRSSPPTAPVDVLITAEYHGVSIEIHDGGVGMPPDALQQANALLAHGESEIELTELGNPPRTGLAGCGVLSATYGFSVRLDPASSRGGLRAVLLVPHNLLTTLEPEPVPASAEPAPAEPAPAEAAPAGPAPGEPARTESAQAESTRVESTWAESTPRHDQPEPGAEAERPATTTSGLPKRPRRTVTRSGDLSAPGTPAAETSAQPSRDIAQGLRGLQRAARSSAAADDPAADGSTGSDPADNGSAGSDPADNGSASNGSADNDPADNGSASNGSASNGPAGNGPEPAAEPAATSAADPASSAPSGKDSTA